MQCTYLNVKYILNNISGQDFIIIDVPTEIFLKEKKVKQESFNAHFAEANHNGEDDWEARLIDQLIMQKILEKENPFGNMSWKLFSQMD